MSAKELYPDCQMETWFASPSDYDPIIRSFGTVLLQSTDADWQGDTYAIVRDEFGKYGYLTFGWGSCSGCDALQACDSYADIEALIDNIGRMIHWEYTLADLQTWFMERDWPTKWEWHNTAFREFATAVQKLREYPA